MIFFLIKIFGLFYHVFPKIRHCLMFIFPQENTLWLIFRGCLIFIKQQLYWWLWGVRETHRLLLGERNPHWWVKREPQLYFFPWGYTIPKVERPAPHFTEETFTFHFSLYAPACSTHRITMSYFRGMAYIVQMLRNPAMAYFMGMSYFWGNTV